MRYSIGDTLDLTDADPVDQFLAGDVFGLRRRGLEHPFEYHA
jgi:hypothetical protein